jgi:hypothetical protein
MATFFSTCDMNPLYPYQSLHVLRHAHHSHMFICHMIPQQLLLFYASHNYLSATDEFNS